jgi:hypothetical protein
MPVGPASEFVNPWLQECSGAGYAVELHSPVPYREMVGMYPPGVALLTLLLQIFILVGRKLPSYIISNTSHIFSN